MSMKYVMDLHAKIMQMRTKDIELARNGLCRKAVQTRTEDKLVWTMPSVASFACNQCNLPSAKIVKGERKAYQVYLNMLFRTASYLGQQPKIGKIGA